MERLMSKHYRVEVKKFLEAGLYLDGLYQTGWRVVHMAAHPDGFQGIFLLEKMEVTKKD
jgi:hypothetical protein